MAGSSRRATTALSHRAADGEQALEMTREAHGHAACSVDRRDFNMFPRRLFPVLCAVPLFAVLAPRAADACSPPSGFTVERSFPAADAVDVGRGINIVVVGEGWPGAQVKITVSQAGTPVEGTLFSINDGRHMWNPAETLLPEAVYDVRVESSNINVEPSLEVHEFSFTTSDKLSPESVAPKVQSAVVEVYEREIKECVGEEDMGSCGGCSEWKVVDVEQRLRLVVDVEQPAGIYDGFRGSLLEWSVVPDMFEEPFDLVFQGADAGVTHHVVDLARAGEWPGSQVCINVVGKDPIDEFIIVPDQPDCIDVSALNVEVEGGSESSDGEDTSPTTGGDEPGGSSGDGSGDESGDGPGMDDGKEGCGCRSNAAPGGSLAWLVLGLLVVRPRRRVR